MSGEKDAVDLAEDEYVVARIAGMKYENNIKYYLIEWDGYDLKDNTWEEEANVYSEGTISAFLTNYTKQTHCKKSTILSSKRKILLRNTYDPDTQQYYYKKLPSKTTAAAKTKVSATTTTKTTTTTTTKVLTDTTTNSQSEMIIPTSMVQTKKRARELIESETESVNVSKPVKARVGIEILSLENQSAFEKTMATIKNSVPIHYPIVRMSNNQMINKHPVYHVKNLKTRVTVVNEIDSELPSDFIYIDQLRYTDPVQPPDPDFLPGCNCSSVSDCSGGCHDMVTYDHNGRLLINQGTAIYECNQACGCSGKCKNRVVQRGRKIPLQVFKTPAKGWGVRSTQFIHKGTFIEEYIGEVIKVEEGDLRGAVYDKLGCSYLFDMDFAQSELPTKYVIDSYILGNVSRFFNHSCSPNLEVYAVFYDSADNQMHRLAFFAKRDIQKDEELCFDYNGRRDVSVDDDTEGAARYSCHCDSTECRKWIYH